MMRKHNGMRPQDIVILLKVVTFDRKDWLIKDMSHQLKISAGEISDSLNRSQLAGLVDAYKKNVHRQSLMEFIEHGLPYVFPVMPGTMVNGMYTAHSHPVMQQKFPGELNYVWPDLRGEVRGLAIEPLYREQVYAAQLDERLYLGLAMIDVLRVGRVREIKEALTLLKKLIL